MTRHRTHLPANRLVLDLLLIIDTANGRNMSGRSIHGFRDGLIGSSGDLSGFVGHFENTI